MNLAGVTVGDIYVDENGRVCRVKSYCMEPTITMCNVIGGKEISGSVGSLNMKYFRSIDLLSADELIKVTEALAISCESEWL